MNSNATVCFEGISRSFGGHKVLAGASGKIAAGRVVGLLGRNGEGKTTLLKILLDMLACDGGRAVINGLSPDGSGEIRQHVGYIPERPLFHGFMTAQGVLETRAGFFRNWDMTRAKALASKLELPLGTRVRGMSKGSLAKLTWICAAAHNPKVFFLDEPTSGLDALVRDDILKNLITELTGEGKTILVTNHRMEEMAGVLDAVWVLSGGAIAFASPMEELMRDARHIKLRLKDGAQLPEISGLTELNREGGFVELAALSGAAEDKLRATGAAETMETAGLSLNKVFSVLLKQFGGNRHV